MGGQQPAHESIDGGGDSRITKTDAELELEEVKLDNQPLTTVDKILEKVRTSAREFEDLDTGAILINRSQHHIKRISISNTSSRAWRLPPLERGDFLLSSVAASSILRA